MVIGFGFGTIVVIVLLVVLTSFRVLREYQRRGALHATAGANSHRDHLAGPVRVRGSRRHRHVADARPTLSAAGAV